MLYLLFWSQKYFPIASLLGKGLWSMVLFLTTSHWDFFSSLSLALLPNGWRRNCVLLPHRLPVQELSIYPLTKHHSFKTLFSFLTA